jgi:hypothetical protein
MEKTYPLVALQLNLSHGSRPRNGPTPATKDCSRFIIREYIKRTRTDRLPRPALIAVHDNATKPDRANIMSAFNERHQQGGGRYNGLDPNGKTDVGLLHDPAILRKQDACLTPGDFESHEIFSRIAGGLFQHIDSRRFIVAISYHGPSGTPENTNGKKELILSNILYLRLLTLHIGLISGLQKKYERWKPLYLIFGDFNLNLETEMTTDLRERNWKLYPEYSTSSTGRDFRRVKPVDYILTNGSFGQQGGARSFSVLTFSPLPLKLEEHNDDDISYRFSNKAGLLRIDAAPFIASEDLRSDVNKRTGETLAGISKMV